MFVPLRPEPHPWLARLVLGAGCLFGLAVLLLAWPQRALAEDKPAAAPALCRFGVTTWEYVRVQDFDLGALRAGWYVDYPSPAVPRPSALDYTPMLRLRQVGEDGYRVNKSWAQIDALLLANPGSMVMIGNEPDRRFYQDDMAPAAYARAYHDLYYYVKGRDPTAQVLAGNIVQPTPVRLQYLDLVLAAYRSRYGEEMPVDAWSIHAFILNERSCAVYPGDCWGADIPPGVAAAAGQVIGVDDTDRIDLFVAGIERFRGWMTERGYRDVPLYVTELGVLMPPDYGYPPERVSAFMRRAFDYLLSARSAETGYARDGSRLVQRFAWYAVIEPFFNGGLFESTDAADPAAPPYVITPIGAAYRDYAAAIAPEAAVDLLSVQADPPPPASAGEFTATLAVRLANSGNLQVGEAVQVAVYDGPPAGQPPLAPPQTVLVAGCGATVEVTIQWRSPAGGSRSGLLAVVAEGAGARRVRTVPFFEQSAQLYLPLAAALP